MRFTDNGDGTVTDHKTGLIWLRDASALGRLTWPEAVIACAALADWQYGLTDGSNAEDWRLPNINELCSLIDRAQVDPALPEGHPFVRVEPNVYWSATSYVCYPSCAWLVGFGNGYVSTCGRTSTAHVWPVRNSR